MLQNLIIYLLNGISKILFIITNKQFRLLASEKCFFLSILILVILKILIQILFFFKCIFNIFLFFTRLSNQILWAAIANFVLSPIIFGLQIMYTFFKYTEVCVYSEILILVDLLTIAFIIIIRLTIFNDEKFHTFHTFFKINYLERTTDILLEN